jgi:hypothetical protein
MLSAWPGLSEIQPIFRSTTGDSLFSLFLATKKTSLPGSHNRQLRSSDVSARRHDKTRMKNPPMSSGGRHSHKSETRISAIAHSAAESKQKKKALPLFP